eukprot:TRINITY_DN13005_c0_g1_i1.p1 TRINITY_DN13005_c0_g1~~TRINITY_DN13005_c0_g1_i1.p1  ORF type:complete len:609 (+),score=45.09 TRINITY_DN13005_c0_g1_i1:107-1933(+)
MPNNKAMANLSSVALLDTTIPFPPLHYSSKHLRPTSRRLSISQSITKRFAYTSCEQKKETGNDAEPRMRMDRRNVLLSLGGLYGAASLGHDKKANGSPVVVDLQTCHDATVPEGVTGPLKCCPPFKSGQTKIVDFKFPSQSTPMRVRKPAHEMKGDDLAKYKEAIRIMKEDLSPDDPWHFTQQAKVHCAYCNDAYYEVGTKDTPVNVHGSWVFLPWHRFYLYFFERILGKLVGDDTLAIPFWNWDSPEGMSMPSIFSDPSSPLYDEARNPDHLHLPAVIDLQSGTSPTTTTPEEAQEVINSNLLAMATMFDNNLRPANLFLGEPISAGEVINKSGACETVHFPAHLWVGRAETPRMDMGNLFSSANDPLFYSHHSNVDRMWHLYRGFRGNQLEFNDPDWLDAAFYFYDENRDLVRVKIRDTLSAHKLRFTYEEVPLPWREGRARVKKSMAPKKKAVGPSTKTPVGEFGAAPKALEKTLRAIVPRPKISRNKSEKEDEVEILIIDGIEDPDNEPIAFDIYIAVPSGDTVGPDLGELAGCFVRLPHGKHFDSPDPAGSAAVSAKSIYKLGLTSLIDDLDANNAKKLVVSLVPRQGTMSIGGLRIELLKCD